MNNSPLVTKKQLGFNALKNMIEIICCPICHSPLSPTEKFILCCTRGHSFDISKKGYFNLAPTAQQSQYDKKLFESRRKIFIAGFYKNLEKHIVEILAEYSENNGDVAVLDAGCGEGYFLNSVYKSTTYPHARYIGMDISKQAVMSATDWGFPPVWCVADLANIPLADSSVDVVLNILSPANYSEFSRILKPQGIMIKVVPSHDYLLQIRTQISDLQSYSNKQVIEHAEKHMEILKCLKISDTLPVTKSEAEDFVTMTPLTTHVDKNFDFDTFCDITISFDVIVAKSK